MFRRRVLLCGLAVLAVLGSWAVWPGSRPGDVPTPPDDPRLTFPTPFRNVRPEVQYVGDESCAGCHPRHAETYRRHPMGRSLAAVTRARGRERYEPTAHNPFASGGFSFLVEQRGDRVFHKETRPSPTGRTAVEFTAEVQFVIGSGTRAHSYLVNHDGHLFQSAITWYSQKKRWDLSPGFAGNPHSDRAITTECLFCHCNRVEPVADTINRYREPIFHGYSIGCERCHGPGELHVRRRERKEAGRGAEDTIVNPGRLPPVLREAVCQQCHLQGVSRVLRRGRQPFDYRPGLPLDLFWSVFVQPSRPGDKAVSQVEQMVASRCFRASSGKLGCTSCHDPHELPPEEKKTGYYRSRCLTCHTEASCGLAPAARHAKDKDDSCVGCHMKRLPTADVAHTALTDHRLLRPGRAGNRHTAAEGTEPGEGDPLVPFLQAPAEARDSGVSRDLGIALTRLAESSLQGQPGRVRLARNALLLLEAAVRAAPDDLPGRQAQALALWLLGRQAEALEACEVALTHAPRREETLACAAALSAQLGKHEQAVGYWRRALAVDPWSARYHYELARLLVLRQEWPAAVEESRAAVRLHPFHLEARKILVLGYLQTGRRGEARAELDRLLGLDPPDGDLLQRWFEPQIGSRE
ncbi:MAG TPA: hypothetical protein VG013_20455 [Gemmataceae bacterium]|jgi:hypothetical protein|nr:hypothetical protein [Gemmataceae bacterium]